LDVDGDFPLGHSLDFFLEFLDLRPFLTDDDPGPGGPDGNLGPVHCPLDLHLGDRGMVEFVLNVPAEEDVLLQELGVKLLRIPSRIPGLYDP
jgi:hypothetical protein